MQLVDYGDRCPEFIFNFSRVIRMSSPMINNVVLLGYFFCYTFVLLLGIDSRFVDDHVFGILCNERNL